MNSVLFSGAFLLQNMLATIPGEDVDMMFGERASYALRMLVVGLLMVFAVLAVLWGALVLSRIFLHDIPEKKKAKKASLASAVSRTAEELPVSVPEAPDDTVLIAVITAAVAAAMEADGTAGAGGFRVVSFRRAQNSAWNRRA